MSFGECLPGGTLRRRTQNFISSLGTCWSKLRLSLCSKIHQCQSHYFRLQKTQDPGSVFNILQNNSSIVLKIFNALGLDTITARFQSILKFANQEMAKTKPNSEGYFIERFLAEADKNEKDGNSSATFYGKNGEAHIIGTILDCSLQVRIFSLLLLTNSKLNSCTQALTRYHRQWNGSSTT